MRKTITALAALGIVAGLAAAVPAQAADYGWGYHNGWRGHEGGEHGWRGYGWRGYGWHAHHRYHGYPGYYGYYNGYGY
jgi:hypothetical protein